MATATDGMQRLLMERLLDLINEEGDEPVWENAPRCTAASHYWELRETESYTFQSLGATFTVTPLYSLRCRHCPAFVS